MNHAASKDLKPARVLADLAAFSAAHKTLHIHFGRWFREWEIRSPETRADILPEHAPRKINQRSLQISKSNVLANDESFYLIELNFRTRRDLLMAEAHARGRDPYRWRIIRIRRRIFAHGTNLSWRCLRTKHNRIVAALTCLYINRILHFTRGMVEWEV